MRTIFAHQYEHLHSLQYDIRDAKCRVRPLLNGASSDPSIPNPVEALKHFEQTIELYCTSALRFLDDLEQMSSGEVKDWEEKLAIQWFIEDKHDPLFLRDGVLPAIRVIVKRVECSSIPNESSPSKAAPSIQTHHEPITMSGNIVDDSNNDALSSHTEDQPYPSLQPIGSNTCPVPSDLVPVLKTDTVSHINDGNDDSESMLSSNYIDDHSNDIMTNDCHSNLKLVPITISGTAPKKKSPHGDLLIHEIIRVPSSNDNSISVNGNDNPIDSSSKAYHSNDLKPIPVPGTSPKKKSFNYFAMAQMPPSFHNLPRSMPYARRSNHRPFQARREGSRPNSIFIPSIHPFSESIAATKHPPDQLHYASASIHNPNSDTDCLRRDLSVNNYKHLHNEPWPDDQNPSCNCIVVCPPFYCIP